MLLFVLVVAMLWLGFRPYRHLRWLAAVLLAGGVVADPVLLRSADGGIVGSPAQARPAVSTPDRRTNATRDAMNGITIRQLTEAQPGLVAKALMPLQPRLVGRSNTYAITVAAGGAQHLFAREAKLALAVAAARFGPAYRGGVMLSNGSVDLLTAPLATRGNLAAVARGVASRIDPAQDLVFVYVVSHGSPAAELATDLPDESELPPISAATIADTLNRAGIKRRIIVISACFAGSWIPALASDETIVIAAARRDRTSFGCDDTRRLTYFGEAFLESPLAHGGSLHESFDAARKTVASAESRERLTPSKPQVFVGRDMQAIWNAR